MLLKVTGDVPPLHPEARQQHQHQLQLQHSCMFKVQASYVRLPVTAAKLVKLTPVCKCHAGINNLCCVWQEAACSSTGNTGVSHPATAAWNSAGASRSMSGYNKH
jgi:hypothetical protein